jgi:ribulose-5-phosphate 4-epimerase/fuculose-1-phosphate aldolase
MIETKRLLLRPFEERDAADLFAYLQAPMVHCFACMKLNTPEEAQAEVKKRAKDTEYLFAIVLKETGKVIVETFTAMNPNEIPAVLVHSHGPFVWGADAMKSVENAITLEEVAFMAFNALALNPKAQLQQALLDKHYLRKHGSNAYYGQGGK